MSTKTDFVKLGNIKLPKSTISSAHSRVPALGNYLQGSVDPELLEELAECINHNIPILLEGPTGCGKTATIKWLAGITNNSYERVQMTGSTDIDNFVGRFVLQTDPKSGESITVWEDGVLTRAMKNGYWLLLDEFNMGLPEIITLVNSVLDDDRTLRLDSKDGMTVIEAHENFRVFATQNPPDDYAGTKDLNLATKNRFACFEFTYPSAEFEAAIIAKHTGIDINFGRSLKNSKDPFLRRLVKIASEIRKSNEDQTLSAICSTRQLIQWANLAANLGIKRAGKIALVNKSDSEERKIIQDSIDKEFSNAENFKHFDSIFKSEEKEIKKQVKKDAQAQKLKDTYAGASNAYRELMSEFGEFAPDEAEVQEFKVEPTAI